jgi:type IV pilus assembly protein PilO
MRRGPLIIGILVTLLLTAAWWFFLVSPQRERAQLAEDEREQAEQEEFLLRTELAALEKIQDNELRYRAALAELEAAIPDTPQTATLIDDLSELADDTGVAWVSGTYGDPVEIEGEDYLEIPLTIVIEGQFFEVLGYLYGTAELERIVRLDSVAIAPQQEETINLLTVNLSGRAFTTSGAGLPEIDEDALEGEEEEEDGSTTTTAPSDTTTTTSADTTTTTTSTTDTSTGGTTDNTGGG